MASRVSARARQLNGKFGGITRHHPGSDTTELRREIAAQRLADYITHVVAEAPPLTPAQRDRIAALLRTDGSAA